MRGGESWEDQRTGRLDRGFEEPPSLRWRLGRDDGSREASRKHPAAEKMDRCLPCRSTELLLFVSMFGLPGRFLDHQVSSCVPRLVGQLGLVLELDRNV